jgi:3-phytase
MEVGPFPKPGLATVATTGSTARAGIADDPAIWVHPTDPSLSLLIGTDKGTAGGLHVFDLQGTELQFVPGGRHNNVDVRYGFMRPTGPVDLVAACDRNTNQIDIYTVDPQTRLLAAAGTIQTGVVVYGYAMYHSRATGKYYGIVSSDNGVEQWELVARPDGTVGGVLARTYASSHLIEGIVADDELGHLYLGEERYGIYKYNAEPGTPSTPLATVDEVGSASQLQGDVEGLAIYYRRDGLGYLVASSQGNDRYTVYRREGSNEYLGTFELSGARDTDGIDVTNMALGSRYPQGLIVVQNRDVDFRIARWQDVAKALGLAVDTAGYDVRARVPSSEAPPHRVE